MSSIVEEIYKNDLYISDLDITSEILKHDQLDVIDLWLLPQYPFDQWRRKYDYPRLLDNIKQRQADFTVWMQEQGILDEHLLNGYFGDFFEAKPVSKKQKKEKDKNLYLVRTTWDGKMEMQVWHSYSEERANDFDNVTHELVKPFMSYYDWLKQKGRVFSFIDTFEYYNPNTEDEQVYLNHNIRLLKMGGIKPPTNSIGILLRGKKLDFVNASGLDLRGRIYFGSMGNLEFNHCAVNNLKCNELDMPGLHYEYCSVKNIQADNSQIRQWLFYASDVSGNISNSFFDLIRIFGGQFNVVFNNCTIGQIGVEHKDHPHDKNFEKTYRAIAKGARESGNVSLAQEMKILEYDFIRSKKTGLAKHLMTLDKIYWGYGHKPKRLITITILAVIFFGFIYSLSPTSITNLSSNNQAYYLTLLDCLYYSAVTFTTLGYGDLSPMGIMRLFAACEALFGAITVGFLVAGLARSDS